MPDAIKNKTVRTRPKARRICADPAARSTVGGGAGRRPPVRLAFTFLELVLALTTITLLGAAVCMLIAGSFNTDGFLRSNNAAQSEVELAVDRISNNIREGQANSIAVGNSSLVTRTQADVANNYPNGATVTYSLSPDPANASQNVLMENDQRYGNNLLVHHVTKFSVAAVAGVADLYKIDLVVGTQMAEERHFLVLGRN